jgi:hypothetical protein
MGGTHIDPHTLFIGSGMVAGFAFGAYVAIYGSWSDEADRRRWLWGFVFGAMVSMLLFAAEAFG